MYPYLLLYYSLLYRGSTVQAIWDKRLLQAAMLLKRKDLLNVVVFSEMHSGNG